jgi:hypothetical protein
MKKLIISQFVVLLLGTIFAWANFVWELVAWLNSEPCPTGCVISAEPVNPFLTPCFYGALFFLIAFILSFFILRFSRK